jgi:hypothetical protein
MRTLLLTAAFAVCSVSLAHAADIMASRYGNTTLVTDPKGVQTKIYYKADGTLTGKQADLNFTGTWKVANGKVCIKTTPTVPGMEAPFCPPVAAHKVGETWKSDDRTVKLVAGVQ